MELAKPQAGFWRHRWQLKKPGAKWTLTGHSRAMVRTGFMIEELKVFLDAGVAWKTPNPMPSLICVTHTHIDHCNALPMLLRTQAKDVSILAPSNHIAALREMADMTWSVKRPGWNPSSRAMLPDRPSAPWTCPIDECGDVARVRGTESVRRWVPVQPADCFTIAKKDWSLEVVRCFHTIEDVGYLLCDTVSRRRAVDDEAQAELEDIERNMDALKQRGEKKALGVLGRRIGEMLKEKTAVPRFAFLCDTTVQVFGPCSACQAGGACIFAAASPHTAPCGEVAELEGQACRIFECSTVVVECSFVAVGMDEAQAEAEAMARGHVAWPHLRPIVEAHPEIEFILVHFSERYTDQELRDHFACASSQGGPLFNVLLWLDEGLSRGSGTEL